jgi:hypothetical protein
VPSPPKLRSAQQARCWSRCESSTHAVPRLLSTWVGGPESSAGGRYQRELAEQAGARLCVVSHPPGPSRYHARVSQSCVSLLTAGFRSQVSPPGSRLTLHAPAPCPRLRACVRAWPPPHLPCPRCRAQAAGSKSWASILPVVGAAITVSAPFPSWNRSILTEIYPCHACSYHEIEDGNGAPGGHRRRHGRRRGAPSQERLHP